MIPFTRWQDGRTGSRQMELAEYSAVCKARRRKKGNHSSVRSPSQKTMRNIYIVIKRFLSIFFSHSRKTILHFKILDRRRRQLRSRRRRRRVFYRWLFQYPAVASLKMFQFQCPAIASFKILVQGTPL